MKKLLVPTDFSPYAEKALKFAIEVASRSGGEILLMHIYEKINDKFSSHKQAIRDYNAQQEQERSIRLDELQKSINEQGLSSTTLLYSGEVAETISWAAKEKQVDCIVMGTLGATGLKTVVFGTKTASVLSESKIPVIAIPYNYAWNAPQKLLIAINDAEENPALFKPAFNLATYFDAKIETLIFSEENAEAVDVIEHSKTVNRIRQRLSKHYPERRIETSHVTGEEFHKTVKEYIDTNRIDLLVMVNHPRNLLENLFRLSHTRQMACHTTVPLLSLQSGI